jgi:hypothetical protein
MSFSRGRKGLLEKLLTRGEIDAIAREAGSFPAVVRSLIGLSYDKARVESWRAMEAIGRITAGQPAGKARNTIERLLWMMREESGTNPWTAAEIIGEIVAGNPGPFEDIVPIVVHFAEEPIMRAGALRAMYRIGSVSQDLVRELVPVALEHMGDADPQVRGYAALALGAAGAPELKEMLNPLSADTTEFLFYDGGELRPISVGEAARMAMGEMK